MDSQLRTALNNVMSTAPFADKFQVPLHKEMVSILVFSLRSSENFGIPVACIEEILPESKLHFIPGVPDYILGVMIWHLEIIAVLDVERCLQFPARQSEHKRSRFLILRWDEMVFGLKVPMVVDVVSFPQDKILAMPPDTLNQAQKIFFQGYAKLDQKITTLLNLEMLVKKTIEEV